MTRIMLLILMVAATFTICGFNVRDSPPGAKFSRSGSISSSQISASHIMPSEDPLWKSFAKCKLQAESDFAYSITYIPAVKALNGKEITIGGFMQPLETKEKFTHFLLSRRSPTCAFCPPGEPNEIVEVFSASPVKWEENLVNISGKLILINDRKKGVFFQMKDAVVRS